MAIVEDMTAKLAFDLLDVTTRYVSIVSLVLGGIVSVTAAQPSSATVVGTVVDNTGGVLRSAEVLLFNVDTSASHRTLSEADGTFTLPALPPGRYVMKVALPQFAATEVRDIVLNVGDRVAMRVALEVASLGETATVVAEPGRVSTSPAVGTVVDRLFVENMPLNGRSLHALLELTPGVVISAGGGGSGFSVNGQRASANYFMVDGVGANAGMGRNAAPGQDGSGQTPGFTALGGTAGLVTVDALQEFRIETSSYAPEFGRTPGGQVSLVTRSGTNVLHGSVFEYFRHEAMGATDWFVNNRGLDKPRLRQHNFGGVLGGALFPNRTFYFGSYEGLHLLEPRAALLTVPSAATRSAVRPELRPYVNAFPMPNGRDVGGGAAELALAWSNPGRADTASLRLDHNAGSKIRLFGRGSYSPSYIQTRNFSTTDTSDQDNTSLTFGATWTVSPRIVHDSRVNYTHARSPVVSELDDFGGAQPPSVSDIFLAGRDPSHVRFGFIAGANFWQWGAAQRYEQRQINFVDTLVVTTRSHEWKLGLDFRRLNPVLQGKSSASQQIAFGSIADLVAGRVLRYFASWPRGGEGTAEFDNLSLYAQDAWRLASRLTLTYGLRWELVPPPRASGGMAPATATGLDDPLVGPVRLAPNGTPLWKTRYTNIAPRIGASYMLSDRPAGQLVIRGGFGTFYDLGYGEIANAFVTYPFNFSTTVNSPGFPLSTEVTAPPDFDRQLPSSLSLIDPGLKLPLTYQWNVAVEQSLGSKRTITVSYVRSEGHRLLKASTYRRVRISDVPGPDATLNVTRNAGSSDYGALQVQYQQRLHDGLQAMIAYTWGRSRDTGSTDISDGSSPIEYIAPHSNYGYSDYDVRHNFTAATTYQLPPSPGTRMRAILNGWSADLLLRVRTGTPVNITTTVVFPTDSFGVRPHVVPGQAFWIADSTAAGGRRLNPNAFSRPPAAVQGDLSRGAIRGFAVKQADLALRRDIPMSGRVRLQVRFEMFNLFNTPNFANPTGNLASPSFGISTSMLAPSLSGSGLNAAYQIGGPRSSQVALKVSF